MMRWRIKCLRGDGGGIRRPDDATGIGAIGRPGAIPQIKNSETQARPTNFCHFLGTDELKARGSGWSNSFNSPGKPIRKTRSSPISNAEAEADNRFVEEWLNDDGPPIIDDLFVEVGDQAIYCLSDRPALELTILIVDNESNPACNIVNERTPIA
jgi:hypothetical protein